MTVKALFLSFDRTPLRDMEQVVKIAKSEGSKICGSQNIKVLNIMSCSYPQGYVVVVENPGREGKEKKEK